MFATTAKTLRGAALIGAVMLVSSATAAAAGSPSKTPHAASMPSISAGPSQDTPAAQASYPGPAVGTWLGRRLPPPAPKPLGFAAPAPNTPTCNLSPPTACKAQN